MRKKSVMLAVGIAAAMSLVACSGANTGGTGGGAGATGGATGGGAGTTLNVLMVGNPQMKDIEGLAPKYFTDKTGIKVNFTILPENELRDKVAQDVATQAGQYDVVTIGAYEGSVWTANDWLVNLQPLADKDTTFDVADIMPAMKGVLSKDNNLYAIPFYGESAFTMYRKDIFDKYKLTMPEQPTWDQIRDFAKTISEGEKDSSGMAGICLRGLPGWGENMAVIGSMMNSFGGAFFDDQWTPLMTSDGTKKAIDYYADVVTKYGEPGAAQSGFTECLNTMAQGKAAMWFDATSAANSLESPDASTVAGKMGYADAPKDVMRAGWVWAWAWAVPKTTKNQDAAWQFISWASGKDYEKTAGQELGWTRVPDGKRVSTFSIPEYKEATKAYSDLMLKAIEASDPTNCGVQKRPAPGCQYLAIPEFADLGAKIGQEMSAVISGSKTVDQALDTSQKLEEAVAAKHK